MAIVVNKDEKRRNIALSCRDLLLEHGIRNLTVSQIARTAGVGKGTIYEYFGTKEEIVFAIMETIIDEVSQKLETIEAQSVTAREKLFRFGMLPFGEECAGNYLQIYREFLGISLMDLSEEMIAFSQRVRRRFESMIGQIMAEARQRDELRADGSLPVGTALTFWVGLVADSRMDDFDVAREFDTFLDLIFAPTPSGETA